MNTVQSKINVEFILLIVCVVLIQGCSQIKQVEGVKDGPGRELDVSSIPDAIPRIEPVTVAGNKNPYTVFGKTYHLLPSAEKYRQVGIASWYGTKFHGNPTSNGEIYDMYAMTGAHKTLPIPSYVRVTNLENNRSIVIRINDRGPFHRDRIIDLSYVGALKLGFADQGTARVEVQALRPETKPNGQLVELDTQIQPQSEARGKILDLRELPRGGVFLQIGAFIERSGAEILKEKIQPLTSLSIEVLQHKNLFKVKIGPIRNSDRLTMLQKKVNEKFGIASFILWP
ncbi:MAG: septal ring lytic transglycosylase RlpA family lipoprotein [Porticoccaceae bacterium]|nr:septal ring lytic transglycosylase RlpA family lipoprotein [Porticoccaceae bacterium]